MAALLAAALGACSSGPPVPDWQLDAHAAMADVLEAQLSGEQRREAAAFERARAQIARTGQTGLMARAELMRCAARVASLDFTPCSGFEARRADAGPADLAYAQYLAGTRPVPDAALLPEPHRSLAAQADAAAEGLLKAAPDPLARLVAAGVLLRQGRGNTALAELATDTAAAQGWRRPLLAWLQLQREQAERAGNTAEAGRLARRIALVLEAPPR
ncbi:MAG: hypothetical protein HY855_18075 [Burkholderiales bacterium]|nr:hypothetical protein [Burkholderiales bacterium]